jgi:predicted DNA-binding transcriptional regulator AlpA
MNAVNTPEKTIPALLSVSALARFLGIGRTTLYEWLYSEQLPPPVKIINNRRYWTAKQIEHFLGEKTK